MRRLSIYFALILIVGLAVFFSFRQQNIVLTQQCIESEEEQQYNNLLLEISNTNSANFFTNITNIGNDDFAGAIECLAISDVDSNRMLAGADNGGLWITTNRGQQWQPVNDFSNSLKVRSVAQNHFKHNQFYYSTGADITINGVVQKDIYKSIDGGFTFTQVNSTGTSQFGGIDKIICSPLDSNTIYFMYSNGYGNVSTVYGSVFKTTDDFATHQKVFQATSTLDDFMVTELGEVVITEGSKVWKSTSGNNGTFALSNTGIPSTVNKMLITCCKLQPSIYYTVAFVAGATHIYKSINAGQNWSATNTTLTGYPRTFAVKPNDPNFLMFGAVQLKASTDGGTTWQNAGGGYDNRAIVFDPNRNGIVFVCSDFGISSQEIYPFTSTSLSAIKTYDATLMVQESHYGDYSNNGIMSISGFQDIGSRVLKTNGHNSYVYGSDGCYCYISKQNSNIGYCSMQNGKIFKANNLNGNPTNSNILNELDSDNNGSVDEGAIFFNPFVMNNTNDQQLFFTTKKRLWRSINSGTNWQAISHYYTSTQGKLLLAITDYNNPIAYWSNRDSVFAMQNAGTSNLSEIKMISPGNPERIYVDPQNDSCIYFLESSPVKIYHSSNLLNGNVQWTNIISNFPTGISARCLAVHPSNNQVMLIGSEQGGIYFTTDGGQSWSKESLFPNVKIKEIKIRPSDNKVFVFTYGRGIWNIDFPLTVSVNLENESSPNIYPTVFDNKLNIQIPNKYLNSELRIFALDGSIVKTQKIESEKFETYLDNNFANGTYIISIRTNEKIILSKKIIHFK